MNDLVKQNKELAAANDADFGAVSPEQNITKSDIAIPRILLMQGQSPRVLEGEASFGEVVSSSDWRVLGKAKQGDKKAQVLEVLPIHWEKFWIIKAEQSGKWKTVSVVKMDHTNENEDPWGEWEVSGVKHKRIYLHSFYVHIKGNPIPFNIGFKGASKTAGDALVTQMYVTNKALNAKEAHLKSPMGQWIKITPIKKTKDSNTFIVLECAASRPSHLDEALASLQWYKSIKSGEAKADLAADEDEEMKAAPKGELSNEY